MKRVLFVLLMVVLAIPCFANDGAMKGIGGSLKLLSPEHSSVRMVSEKVEAVLTRDMVAKVRCTFVFENQGEATTVKMGFPEDSEGEGQKQYIKDFKSWVNGEPVETELVEDKSNNLFIYKGWFVKDVHFEAGETLTVVDTYTGGVGRNVDGHNWFRYVLKTGASWKGTIGSVEVSVDVSDFMRRSNIVSLSPAGYSRKGGVVKWNLKDLEPNEDISVVLISNVMVSFYDGKESYSYSYPDDLIENTNMVEAHQLFYPKGSMEKQNGKYLMKANGHSLLLTPGSKIAVLDGKKEIKLPQAPYVKDEDLIIPIASVVRSLGGKATLRKGKEQEIVEIRL